MTNRANPRTVENSKRTVGMVRTVGNNRRPTGDTNEALRCNGEAVVRTGFIVDKHPNEASGGKVVRDTDEAAGDSRGTVEDSKRPTRPAENSNRTVENSNRTVKNSNATPIERLAAPQKSTQTPTTVDSRPTPGNSQEKASGQPGLCLPAYPSNYQPIHQPRPRRDANHDNDHA